MVWDNKIAFWIKGVPYLWVDNKDWKKCKRIYLVSPKTRAFDIEGKSKALQTFWEERTPFYDGVSLVENCEEGVSNYFMVSVPPVKRRGLNWWMEQPGFPFKGFELRSEGKKFLGEIHFPVLSKLEVVLPKSEKYFTGQVPPMSELNLEDLPDEVLSMIAENSPGLGFGLANKRLAGIWKEKNGLRRLALKKLILGKDKKAGAPKFSNAFGYKEIKLCVDTKFFYPLEKHLGSWLKKGVGAKKCDTQKLLPALITMRLEGRKFIMPSGLETSAKEAGYSENGLYCLYSVAAFGAGETVGDALLEEQSALLEKFKDAQPQKRWRKDWFLAGFFFSLSKKFVRDGDSPIGKHITSDLGIFFRKTHPDDWDIASAIVEKTSKKFREKLEDYFLEKDEDVYSWLFEPQQTLPLSSQSLIKFLTREEHPASLFVAGSVRLEDLPDEVLSMIAENSPGLSFGLANKRLAGIWNEANDLRRLILKKDKKAGNPKFSDRFGKEEIELCLDTGFLYPIRKNFYGKWTKDKTGYFSPSFILFGRAIGERQELPPLKWIEATDDISRVPDMDEFFGKKQGEITEKYVDALGEFKHYISFGLGQSAAKNQNKKGEIWNVSSFRKRKEYLDSWFLMGYTFENRDRRIDWKNDIPVEVQKQFEKQADELRDYGDGISFWITLFYFIKSIGKETKLKDLSKYLIEEELVPEERMKKFWGIWDRLTRSENKRELEILSVN